VIKDERRKSVINAGSAGNWAYELLRPHWKIAGLGAMVGLMRFYKIDRHSIVNLFKTGPRGNLVVTGGLGFLGSHTIVEILKDKNRCGYKKIIIIDDMSNSKPATMARIL
jgi:hypothetical protein